MLKSMTCARLGWWLLNVRWLHSLAAAASMAAAGPRSRMDAKSTAQATGSVDRRPANGRFRFRSDVALDRISNDANRLGDSIVVGKYTPSSTAPTRMTAAM